MHFVIFTGGILEKGKAVNDVLKKADMVIAADSGAKTALLFGVTPEAVIGDFDSIDEQTLTILKQKKCKLLASPAEKNETDTELAVQYAVENNATEISVLGGIEGNRIDHILANISLPIKQNIPIRFVNGPTTAWIEKGPKEITVLGKTNDLLSLIPLTADAEGIQTANLQYPLHDETLYFGKSRGISNVFLKENIIVKFEKGILFFVYTEFS